jgi:hypothetical protein
LSKVDLPQPEGPTRTTNALIELDVHALMISVARTFHIF